MRIIMRGRKMIRIRMESYGMVVSASTANVVVVVVVVRSIVGSFSSSFESNNDGGGGWVEAHSYP
jgi:hypothetical protein